MEVASFLPSAPWNVTWCVSNTGSSLRTISLFIFRDTFLFLGGHTANLRNFEFRICKKPEINVQALRHLLSRVTCRACDEDSYHDSRQLQIFAAIDSCGQHSDDTDMYILLLIRNFLLNFVLPFLSTNFILSHRAFGQSNTFWSKNTFN